MPNSSIAKVFSAELEGINAKLIEVEVDLGVGLHSFNIVGLADKALSEAKERVNSALKNSQIKPPNRENRKITVNLAPADIKKTGSQYDLAIALGYLLASGQIKEFNPTRRLFIGELSLAGHLRPVFGSLSIAELAQNLGYEELYLPYENAAEASLVSGLKIVPVRTLLEAIDVLEGRLSLPPLPPTKAAPPAPNSVDISEIKGQDQAKRALSIAAAGGHNLLMVGPPGSGKSLLAQAFASILPPLSPAEVIEVTKIFSISGLNRRPVISFRPFRSPHHSASAVALIGGGQVPRPGEISLAHRGVLFLDELPEFNRDVLESLRQPLENGSVFISRARGALEFPARFTLIAAMNPCPCGYWGDSEKACRCGAHEIFRYQKKISGPLLDRIDLQIHVPRLKTDELISPLSSISPPFDPRPSILSARQRQRERFQNWSHKLHTNSELSSKECDELISLDGESQAFLKNILSKSFISARGYYRLLKVARTIADLENLDSVSVGHLKEAFSYRLPDGNI